MNQNLYSPDFFLLVFEKVNSKNFTSGDVQTILRKKANSSETPDLQRALNEYKECILQLYQLFEKEEPILFSPNKNTAVPEIPNEPQKIYLTKKQSKTLLSDSSRNISIALGTLNSAFDNKKIEGRAVNNNRGDREYLLSSLLEYCKLKRRPNYEAAVKNLESPNALSSLRINLYSPDFSDYLNN